MLVRICVEISDPLTHNYKKIRIWPISRSHSGYVPLEWADWVCSMSSHGIADACDWKQLVLSCTSLASLNLFLSHNRMARLIHQFRLMDFRREKKHVLCIDEERAWFSIFIVAWHGVFDLFADSEQMRMSIPHRHRLDSGRFPLLYNSLCTPTSFDLCITSGVASLVFVTMRSHVTNALFAIYFSTLTRCHLYWAIWLNFTGCVCRFAAELGMCFAADEARSGVGCFCESHGIAAIDLCCGQSGMCRDPPVWLIVAGSSSRLFFGISFFVWCFMVGMSSTFVAFAWFLFFCLFKHNDDFEKENCTCFIFPQAF